MGSHAGRVDGAARAGTIETLAAAINALLVSVSDRIRTRADLAARVEVNSTARGQHQADDAAPHAIQEYSSLFQIEDLS
jgi:hypothetical protein